ncbi:hypothetical protein JCM39068_40760 [Desulfocastanea catecholica]
MFSSTTPASKVNISEKEDYAHKNRQVGCRRGSRQYAKENLGIQELIGRKKGKLNIARMKSPQRAGTLTFLLKISILGHIYSVAFYRMLRPVEYQSGPKGFSDEEPPGLPFNYTQFLIKRCTMLYYIRNFCSFVNYSNLVIENEQYSFKSTSVSKNSSPFRP